MSSVENVKTVEIFNKILDDASIKGSVVVAHFWAGWAAQCEQMNDVITELSKDPKLNKVIFVKVEAESVPETSLQYGVESVPTFIFFKNKLKVDRLDGANAPELTKKVHTLAQISEIPRPNKEPVDINVRLKKLINAAPCMLFMKGSPQEPKCGFSRQIIEILNKHQAEYSTFDILSDDEVRQGLKTYSNWPTYPQVYINGELTGGLDIIREMDGSGDLASTLPKKSNNEDRLKKLVSKNPVMVFMKGNPQNPKCGFSRTLVDILNNTGVKYDTFDILEDDEVRQNLKTFSNWPTYPQIYVKGELVGGLDIIKELQEAGELVSTLQG